MIEEKSKCVFVCVCVRARARARARARVLKYAGDSTLFRKIKRVGDKPNKITRLNYQMKANLVKHCKYYSHWLHIT